MSGTPLAKKVGVKPGHRVVLRHRPVGWAIPDLPDDVSLAEDGPADVVIAFYRAHADLAAEVAELAAGVAKGSMLWIAWPRRAGGHDSDLTDNVVRDEVLPTGLVDTKVAALGNDWSALKFLRRNTPR